MNDLRNYFLEANLCLLIFGAFYLIFLRSEKHFRLTRFSILGIILASLIIPIFHFTNPFAEDMPMPAVNNFYALIPEALSATPVEATGDIVSSTFWTIPVIISLSYAAVVIILLTLFITQLVQLLKFRISNKSIERGEGYVIILTNGQWPTFSFFNMLFFDNSKNLSADEKQKIVDHELVHVRQRHSLDIVLIELVKIIFWMNPVIWMLRGSMEEVHEYLADEKILKSTDKQYYSSLLAKMALNQMSISVGLHFNKSIILKRIEMMKTPKQKIKMWKWSGMFSIVVLMGIAFSCNDEVMETTTQMQVPPDEAYEIVDVDEYATPLGGFQAFDHHIRQNIRYPAEARKQGIEGTVYVHFVIDTDGTLTRFKVLKGIGAGCDKEAIRVISIAEKWKPAYKEGQIVKQHIVLPIEFSLNNGDGFSGGLKKMKNEN